MKQSVTIAIGNLYSSIIGEIDSVTDYMLQTNLRFALKGARFMASYANKKRRMRGKNKDWDGNINLYFPKREQSFYTGMISTVKTILEGQGVPYTLDDRRIRPQPNMPSLKFHKPSDKEERPYQDTTVAVMKRASRGIMQVGTGGGKTYIITRLIGDIRTAPFLFFVTSKDLLEQAHDNLSECFNVPIGKIGGGEVDIHDINIVMIQTAVSALHRNDPKFNAKEYEFDDEDHWGDKTLDITSKSKQVEKLICSAKGFYFDECLIGNTKIVTDIGTIPISSVRTSGARYVLSYDNGLCFREIRGWWNKGERKVIKIDFDDGRSITCTSDHKIYTESGWKLAGKMVKGEKVLSVSMDVGHGLTRIDTDDHDNMFLTVSPANKQEENENINTKHSSRPYPSSLPIRFSYMCQNAYDTNWGIVSKITDAGKESVYDIEVDSTHCFFANNILAHNCHHVASKTCKEVILATRNAYWRYGGSVGPKSFIEMKGGCFGNGFVGTIEDAFKVASGKSTIYKWRKFKVVNLEDVLARGWNGNEFVWKPCLRMLRHTGKQCLQLGATGVNLLITPEHSVYHAIRDNSNYIRRHDQRYYESRIVGTSVDGIEEGDILVGDDGANFEDGEGTAVDMIAFCQKHMSDSNVMVHCNVKGVDRAILKELASSKSIYNWRQRGSLPLNVFVKVKPRPLIERLTAGKLSIWVAPEINLSNWAYILGFYLGDGWISTEQRLRFIVARSNEKEIIQALQLLNGVGFKVQRQTMLGESIELRINNIFLIKILRSIFGKVQGNMKSIPSDWIINWSLESRRELLRGLMDSDSFAYISRRNGKCNVITTTHLSLSKDICSLLRSLGLWGSFSDRTPQNDSVINGRQIRGKHHTYIVRWSKYKERLTHSEKRSRFSHKKNKFTEIPVREITIGSNPNWIYDLEMSGHPSFVADGVLVHNSATPFREDGAEKMIQALFGKKLVNVSLSYLIENGYLLRPIIFMVDMGDADHGAWVSYPEIYKNYIVENEILNDKVFELVKFFESKNITSMTLVKQYNHGDNIKKLYPDLFFMKGTQSRKKRKETIESLRQGEMDSLIATTLADEGLDIRRLQSCIIAGGGKSVTRSYQRVGRTLRPFADQDRAIIVIFHHRYKYLDQHGKKVLNILKKEKRFIIQNTTLPQLIPDIEAVLVADLALL